MTKEFSRRLFLRMSAVAGVGAVLAACGQAAAPAAAPTTAPVAPAATAAPAPTAAAAAPTVAPTAGPLPAAPAPGPIDLKTIGGMDKLVEAAKKEGELSTIALPNDWANYGEAKKVFFQDKYSFLKHNDLNPDGSSAEEIEAIKANAGSTGPQAPDVIDVGFTWGEDAKKAGLLQPYKVATWDTIPDDLKDPEGFWYADYYGVMTFEVNTQVVANVPQDWSDLLKPEYKGQIALAGDPTAAAQAVYAVWAAALANGGSLDDPMPGLEFFKKLNAAGNLLPVIAKPATVAKGETPITLRWNYNSLSNRDNTAGNPEIAVVVPKSGTIAGVYIQAISAYAPHPHAARLWMEYLYSDEGQTVWLKGYANPVRLADMQKRNVIPADVLAKLPKSDAQVSFPKLAQISPALDKIKKNWASVVGAVIK